MTLQRKYEQKLMKAAQAVEMIKPGQDIITPIITGEPPALMEALPHHEGLRNNRLFQMLSSKPVMEIEENRLKIISMFLGKDERRAFQAGQIDLLPNHFSDVPIILSEITNEPAILATVSPMDDQGYFSLGTNCDYTAPMLETAKTILLEVNEQMPRTYGENQIHIDDITAIVENNQPLPEIADPVITEKDEKIGSYIAQLINNGDIIQIGFGAIPNAVMDFLKNHRNLSIATEMIPNKIVDLIESGAISNLSRKKYQGKTTGTFAFGTKRLYDYLHENKDIYMLPVHKSNHITEIAHDEKIVAINATVEVDFLGQCNSEKVGNLYWSSTGGQSDFGIGARLAKEGRSIICLHSTAKNDEISKIVPTLAAGTPVSTSKNDIDYVVTEYGVAKLRGKAIRERTKELIRIAHPKFREELKFKAKEMGYLL
ncbi:acetyl-CoA hydrolase/transferase C-terminal domain-containing protein [Bacillus sp. FJAT-47783]|uniref:acetyl-CoA hydrolase/transferase family protein n=1 Tax=Bacillus sp. FJAT-47783 TaxID=2922712 RepID=UPI001FAC778A|nr:acetyl-CoA hydrolase/transferase C-terminal domain-containing protein [Bacillus sp. FJAT-47783]